MVSTLLKNISQNGSFPQIGVKIKNIWNHRDLYNLSSTPQGLKTPQIHQSKTAAENTGHPAPSEYLFILSHKIHETSIFLYRLYLQNLYTIQKQSFMDP